MPDNINGTDTQVAEAIKRNYFTNENPNAVYNTTGMHGVVGGSVDISQIEDGVTERGVGLGKLGSSMPTPMARLFLFATAFEQVNSLQSKNSHQGHIGIPDNEVRLVPTPYHDLVSEMLDMLEFTFKYGDHPDFHVERWDIGFEKQNLDRSEVDAHKDLGVALESAFSFGALQNRLPIFLFKWKNHVIGGTSPVSLVYTSANLRSVLNKNRFSFNGDAGNPLFTDQATPLHKRDKAFQSYIYKLYLNYLINSPVYLTGVARYIQDSGTTYSPGIYNAARRAPNFDGLPELKSKESGERVTLGSITFRHSDHSVKIDRSTTDYLLAPTATHYEKGEVGKKIPMILTKYGINGLKYVGDKNWLPGTHSIPGVLTPNIYDRTLPGFEKVKYPYLTVSDFFEDKIIEVSYDINRERFYTGCDDNINFLLPLKKIFFEYFKLSDLITENGRFTDMLKAEYDEEHEKLILELTLPLVHGRKITLTKTYDTSDQSKDKVDCYDSSHTFDFAVFPFYRLEPDRDQNVYNIMLGSSFNGVSLKFFELPVISNQGVEEVTAVVKRRSEKSRDKALLSTDHIHVDGPFSFIELTIQAENVSALVIPMFDIVNSNPTIVTNKYIFGVDFGTTNTHVAYFVGPVGVPIATADPFSYKEEDSQMVMFNSKSGAGEFVTFVTAAKREFVPLTIGETIKFPIRTATFQAAGRPNTLEMFFNTNIGFNYSEDISRASDYKTNIKWDRFDGLSHQRMQTFFTQMLWMMKNKSVLNGATADFTVIVTYPLSIRDSDRAIFKDAWRQAVTEVKGHIDIRYRTESVAPYYSHLAEMKYGEAYANIDIGGGTTDILYVNPQSGEACVFSAFFAADDLWNDGLDRSNMGRKKNGFITYYKETRRDRLGDRMTDVQNMIDSASSSADIINYLFANDSWTRLSETIKFSPRMIQLPVVHFSALMFYMAYAIHLAEFEVPHYISFTGMGSKYVQLISTHPDSVAKIIKAIFRYVGNLFNDDELKKADNIKVSFVEKPKEVTAEGALISLNYGSEDDEEVINPNQDTFYGFEEEEVYNNTSLRYGNLNNDIQSKVIKLFKSFLDMFAKEDIIDALSEVGHGVDNDIITRLRNCADSSYRQMQNSSKKGQRDTDKVKEPMFFWPLKNSLYEIGKEIAEASINKSGEK
ncbi:MAG: hypothetical protein K2H47_05885 [Muribaculaceae bacterium]|nr:hypothetical protein [Muribaculaceae bacterium]